VEEWAAVQKENQRKVEETSGSEKAKVKGNLMNIEKKGRDKSPKGASTFFGAFSLAAASCTLAAAFHPHSNPRGQVTKELEYFI